MATNNPRPTSEEPQYEQSTEQDNSKVSSDPDQSASKQPQEDIGDKQERSKENKTWCDTCGEKEVGPGARKSIINCKDCRRRKNEHEQGLEKKRGERIVKGESMDLRRKV
jgi:hypothetical protein